MSTKKDHYLSITPTRCIIYLKNSVAEILLPQNLIWYEVFVCMVMRPDLY